jgi:hypothetical protein
VVPTPVRRRTGQATTDDDRLRTTIDQRTARDVSSAARCVNVGRVGDARRVLHVNLTPTKRTVHTAADCVDAHEPTMLRLTRTSTNRSSHGGRTHHTRTITRVCVSRIQRPCRTRAQAAPRGTHADGLLLTEKCTYRATVDSESDATAVSHPSLITMHHATTGATRRAHAGRVVV